MHYHNVITNTGDTAVPILFDFVVGAGSLTLHCGAANPTCDGSSSYDINILVNNNAIVGGQSSATLEFDSTGTGTKLTLAGFLLNGTMQSGVGSPSTNASYSWISTRETILLGMLDVNDSIALDYFLTTNTIGNFDNSSLPPPPEPVCTPGPNPICAVPVVGDPGGGTGTIGDPGGPSFLGRGIVIAAIPEPSTLALLAMAGFWITVRRNRFRQTKL
jgi:hypothetical protein